MNNKVQPITAEHIFEILSNPQFRRNIRDLGNQEHKLERAFAVLQEIYIRKYIIGEVGEGTENSLAGAGLWDLDLAQEEGHNSYFLLSLHSHPYEFIIPTVAEDGVGDLIGLSRSRRDYIKEDKLKVKPIEGIVSSLDRKIIDILLIQENTLAPISYSVLESCNDMFDNLGNDKPEDIIKILEETGLYHAAHIPFNSRKLAQEYIERLRKFEFTPEFVKQ